MELIPTLTELQRAAQDAPSPYDIPTIKVRLRRRLPCACEDGVNLDAVTITLRMRQRTDGCRVWIYNGPVDLSG